MLDLSFCVGCDFAAAFSPMRDGRSKWRAAWTGLFLALLTLGGYWPVIHCQFVDYDDDIYITANPEVQSGLTWSSMRWAFTTRYACNWHPVTWISHMLDWQLYGPSPAGHHAVNLVLHILNVVLVFWVLRRLTEAHWRSAFVAALFALHPLHVQSVAWVAERKDVLSTFFGLLTIWAYARYAEESKVQSPKSKVLYGLALLSFALSLMAKSMLVTLPFLLLLLDFWPLKRVSGIRCQVSVRRSEAGSRQPEVGSRKPEAGGRKSEAGSQTSDLRAPPSTPNQEPSTPLHLILEKLPLLLLSGFSCALTLWSQTIAMPGLENVSVASRISNAIVAYLRYVEKMVWPTKLVLLYPLSPERVEWHLALAVLVVGAVSWLAIRWAKTRPYLFTGWFWYFGTLVPVIGVVQVGSQAIADRYTYVPLIGLFIIIAWGANDLVRRWQIRPTAIATIALLPILMCIALTRAQLRHWQDSVALFEHTLRWTANNFLIEHNLARVYMKMGMLDLACQHASAAAKLLPDEPETHLGLGMVLMEQRRFSEAAEQLTQVLHLNTNHWKAQAMLGTIMAEQGRTEEALRQFSGLIRINPTNAEIHSYFAMALIRTGRVRDAVAEYRAALKADPQLPSARNNLAWILASSPDPAIRNGPEAVRLAEHACGLNRYRDPSLLGTLAVAYAEDGRFEEAVDMANRAAVLAAAAGNQELARRNQARVILFLKHQPFRE